MYIKSIVLDGFKSYGNRVEITGFDREFNAITGLNGTGKSNILDSICFVLGITNLSNVRAGSLQELIYKNGQAGITKATVSITFDNRDKNQCPIGYENHDEITVTRQVVLGGKNKYLINGINVQNKRVSDLFCSVQLNVNNPHFLIMQGRITKVLNMKPPEILSMVEEAAGTRMYEAKKQAAQKTIEKKDAKLRELNDIIREDIAPKLQRLQDERAQFQDYQKVTRELENLTRLYVAWKYVSAEENAKQAADKVSEVRELVQGMKGQIQGNKAEAVQLDKQVAELSRKLDQESGSILKELETELQSLEKTEASASSAHKAARDALQEHQKRTRLLERAMADDQKALAAKKHTLDQVSSTFENLKSLSEQSEANLAEAQRKFLAVSTGLEGPSESLRDQLMAAKASASEADTRVSQNTMELRHAVARLDKLEKEFATSGAQYTRDTETINKHQQQIQAIQSELSGLNFSESRHIELRESQRQLQSRARQQRGQLEQLASRLQRAQFHYSDPEPGFDRRRVHGPLCKLFDVRDPLFCTALETVAGGRLYNVVVDNEATSKLILQRGNLQSRTTIIPLNKIHGQVIDKRTVKLAQEVGGGADRVQLALDLISFPAALRPAMEWVFGGTLVCADMSAARAVAFHGGVRRRAVTWDGDVVDPSGTLSGGARPQGGSVLVQIQQLKEAEERLSEVSTELNQVESTLAAAQRDADKYAALHSKYEMMSHELQVTKTRLENTSHAQLHAEIQTLKDKVNSLTDQIQQDKLAQKHAADKAKELQDKVKDIKGHREREFKKAEAELKQAKKAAEEHSSAWKLREQEFETLRLEVSELETTVSASLAQLAAAGEAAGPIQVQLQQAKEENDIATTAVKEMQSRIRKQKAEIAGRSGEIAKLQNKKETLNKQNLELELKIKEQDYKVKELQTEAADCERKIRSLEAEHAWIPGERQYFGLAGGLYDFAGRGAAAAGLRLKQLTDRKDKLARGLNARAHTLLGKEEEQYQDVMRKKKIVEADRAKLVQVMSELDEKKRQTLVAACEQVNKDFGSIFSTLLPGAQAKLAPPPSLTVLDGLEVKVGFNTVWKESLGELSGGQRSLVALSLVLAMLLFKPAPLYILDEVDAALDLSHTQNIGRMLKNHFTHSQFIIVSLKDGMFNNANVLFRTKFVDGMSSVQRTVNQRR